MTWPELLTEAATLIPSVGGILAIPTAIFIVYDRLVRGRPIFAIHADGKIGGENRLFLRVKNVLDEDIVIEDWQITPPLLSLSTDHSIRALVAARIKKSRVQSYYQWAR